jgi:hypothetical protein
MPLLSDLLTNNPLQILGNLSNLLNERSNTKKTIYLKDSRTAARLFGFKNSHLDQSPRTRFLFFVNFLTGDVQNPAQYGNPFSGISMLVKSFSYPYITLKGDTLNQYNKKRIVYSGIEYSSFTIQFYNTYDMRVINMIRRYLSYYYGDFNATSRNAWNNDVLAPLFQYAVGDSQNVPAAIDFDFQIPNVNSFNNNFFSVIELYLFGGNKYFSFSFVNPCIKTISFDNEDYSASENSTITISFEFEGLIFNENQNNTKNPDRTPIGSRASEFGLNISEVNDPKFPTSYPANFSTNTNLSQGNRIPPPPSLTSIFNQQNKAENTQQSTSNNFYESITKGFKAIFEPQWSTNSVNRTNNLITGINPNSRVPSIGINSRTASSGFNNISNIKPPSLNNILPFIS